MFILLTLEPNSSPAPPVEWVDVREDGQFVCDHFTLPRQSKDHNPVEILQWNCK
jgi:hypothetical protein